MVRLQGSWHSWCGALILLIAGGSSAQAQDLRIATEGYYAPFNYIDESGALVGFDIDIANALCTAMSVSCEVVQSDWDALIPGLNADEFDLIVASMSITAEREEEVAFTLPYYSNMLSFIGKSGRGLDATDAALAGKTIGVQRSTISAEYLATTYADTVRVALYDTQEQALLDLGEGAIDLVLGDNLPAYAWLQTDAGEGHQFIGEFVDINDRIAIAARKSDPDLVDRLNGALIEIIESGTYQEINAKYFPFSIYF
ncbi:MAG: transporter substrate-binding domain-containing protein [Pseudomonadota bacterium]